MLTACVPQELAPEYAAETELMPDLSLEPMMMGPELMPEDVGQMPDQDLPALLRQRQQVRGLASS